MASKKFLQLVPSGGFTILNLGDMEIWDGADMALLRESLTRLIKAEKHRRIGIDMRHVKYIPSGFFGMLFDWFETGVQIRLYTPQSNVRKMLWFNSSKPSGTTATSWLLNPRPAATLGIRPMERPNPVGDAAKRKRPWLARHGDWRVVDEERESGV